MITTTRSPAKRISNSPILLGMKGASKRRQGKRTLPHALPDVALQPDQFVLMTLRSHDQYNTTIYGLNDRYRGVHGHRRVCS